MFPPAPVPVLRDGPGGAILDGAGGQGRCRRACPVARESCVTCHMPKYEAPGMHHEFTDHRIRIVAARP